MHMDVCTPMGAEAAKSYKTHAGMGTALLTNPGYPISFLCTDVPCGLFREKRSPLNFLVPLQVGHMTILHKTRVSEYDH